MIILNLFSPYSILAATPESIPDGKPYFILKLHDNLLDPDFIESPSLNINVNDVHTCPGTKYSPAADPPLIAISPFSYLLILIG